MIVIPDYRTTEQKAVDDIYLFVNGQGFKVEITKRSYLAKHAEVVGTVSKDGESYSSVGYAKGMPQMEAMLLAEVDCIKRCLISFGITLDWGEYVKRASPVFVTDDEENSTLTDITYEKVFRCRTLSMVYDLVKKDKEMTLKLEGYQDVLVSNGQRLTVKKAADYLFPKRQARRIGEKVVAVGNYTFTRESNERHKVAARLTAKGITPSNYVKEMPKEIRDKFPNFEAYCTHATDGYIDQL